MPSMSTTEQTAKIVEAWSHYQHADGVVRVTKLRWRLLPNGERVCLGPVTAEGGAR